MEVKKGTKHLKQLYSKNNSKRINQLLAKKIAFFYKWFTYPWKEEVKQINHNKGTFSNMREENDILPYALHKELTSVRVIEM